MSTVLMILLISILIIVHELGHFLCARAFGIKVAKFGFGLPIGPTLYKTKWGETEVFIHAFLLGGYISFPDDIEDNDLPADSPLLFKNKPIYQRAIVISAGVLANILCAIALVLIVAFYWGSLPGGKYDVYVSKILSNYNQSVEKSGLKVGDIIYEINGQKITLPFEINKFAVLSRKFDNLVDEKIVQEKLTELKKKNLQFGEKTTIEKGKTVYLTDFTPEQSINLTKYELIGLEKYKSHETELSQAQQKLRDEIYQKKSFTSDGQITLQDVAFAMSDTAKPINITVLREGEKIELKPIFSNEEGLIGIEKRVEEVLVKTTGFKSGVANSFVYLYDNTSMMIIGLGKIFTGKVALDDLHGIVAITKIGSDIIQHQGLFKGLLLTAVISLNLAIVNLLPIPALDGGHLLFLFIEKVQGKPVNEKILEKIANTGFLFLIVLMFVIIFNDIFALITNKI